MAGGATATTTAGGKDPHATSQRPRVGLRVAREFRLFRSPWTLTAALVALLVSIPALVILANLFSNPGENWEHIREHTLPGYLKNTAILVGISGSLSLLIGVPAAWLVSTCEFPGRKFFSWALVLPLALPTYVAAYAYGDILNSTIPIQILVRDQWGSDAFLMSQTILRYGIVSLILASVLYPYVYLSSRAAFSFQASASIEASRTLGHGMTSTFWRVALPMARPAIVAGLSLVIMEIINDYGAVSFFGIPTISVGIFRTWLAMGDPGAAVRISAGVMVLVLVLLLGERLHRGRRNFVVGGQKANHRAQRKSLSKATATGALLFCLLPFATGFLIPAGRLLVWAFQSYAKVLTPKFWELLSKTMAIAGTGTVTVLFGALLLAYAGRVSPTRLVSPLARMATLGYAVPGAVIALGILLPFGWLDRNPVAAVQNHFGWDRELFFSGTLVALGCAYLVRFLAVAYHPLKSGMERMCGNLDSASRVLGRSPLATLFRINLPLLRGSISAAAILVFVDVLKELPLTLILRPFNFETLATKAYSLASEGKLPECSVPSLLIVAAGIIGLLPLNRLMEGPTRSR